jgi:hypothetical protein
MILIEVMRAATIKVAVATEMAVAMMGKRWTRRIGRL